MKTFQKPSIHFYLGVAAIIVGFFCLRTPPVDGVLTLTIAPILLVLGYVLFVPIGLWPRSEKDLIPANRSLGARILTTRNLVGLGVFTFSLIVYLSTLWPAPGWWDSSGYVTCSYTLAVDAPPGSVLLQLLGRLASVVTFITSPAVRINILIAVISALSMTVVYFTVVHLLHPFESAGKHATRHAVLAGILAALTLAFTHSVWSHATFTNPYALSLLTGSLMIYLAVRWWDNPDAPGAGNFLLLAAFLFGLDLSVHRSNLLLAPAFVLLVLLRKPRLLLDFRLWIGGIFLFVLGVSMQLFVMFRAQLGPQMNFGNPDTWREFWDYLTLSQFGIKTFGSDLLQRKGPFWDYQIKEMYLRYLGWNFTGIDGQGVDVRWTGLWGLPALLGVVGLTYHIVRLPRQALFLIAAFLMASLGAVFYLNVPAGFFREMDRHFLVSFMLFALWVGIGCYAFLKLASHPFARMPRHSSLVTWIVVGVLFAVLPVNLLRANWRNNDMSKNYTSYAFGYNLLQSCEPDAILITAGDNDTFMPWYLQTVEGVRPDVTVLNAPLLNTTWFLRTTMLYHPDLPWSLTEDSLKDLSVVPWETDTVTISGANADSFSCSIIVWPTIADRYLLIQDQVLLNILKQNQWRRPFYFSTGFGEKLPLGLKEHARLDGLVWQVVPNPHDTGDYLSLENNLLHRYNYDGLGEQSFLDVTGRKMTSMYKASFAHLATLYQKHGETEKLNHLESLYAILWPGNDSLESMIEDNRSKMR
jgi:hypothetical protein